MAIPGAGTQIDPVGKIRIGEKAGKGARSIDHFRANEPLFAELCPGDPSEIEIVLIDAPGVEPAWSSGMEWWVQKDGINKLACYTKDAGDNPTAFRLRPYLDPEDEPRGEIVGQNRQPIGCRFRECRHFGKQCKPIGRLTFYIASDAEKRPWRLDTKGWYSIENLEQALAKAPTVKTWKLSVSFQTKGQKRFPVLRMEPSVLIQNEADVAKADALVALAHALDTGQARMGLADYLNATRPGWRAEEALIDKIQEIGPEQAIRNIFKKEGHSEVPR
jgi:hypothetical protein